MFRKKTPEQWLEESRNAIWAQNYVLAEQCVDKAILRLEEFMYAKNVSKSIQVIRRFRTATGDYTVSHRKGYSAIAIAIANNEPRNTPLIFHLMQKVEKYLDAVIDWFIDRNGFEPSEWKNLYGVEGCVYTVENVWIDIVVNLQDAESRELVKQKISSMQSFRKLLFDVARKYGNGW